MRGERQERREDFFREGIRTGGHSCSSSAESTCRRWAERGRANYCRRKAGRELGRDAPMNSGTGELLPVCVVRTSFKVSCLSLLIFFFFFAQNDRG